MRDIIGHGGGKGGGSSHTHYEAPDSLHSTSYARVLDLVSEGEILGLAEGLQSVYLNDTPVQNADGTSNFQGITVDFRTGTQDQDYIPGFPDVESETTVGAELKYGTPWVRAITNTALSAVRITLGVDQLYKADTNNGDVGGSIVSYVVELSTDGGAYQTVLSNSFNGKTMSAYQRSARIDLPRATTGWQIRVSRLTPNSTVVSIVDKTTIVSFTEVIDAKLRYPMSAIVGVQVDAKQFQSVPTRAYDLFGRIIQVPSNYDAKTRAYSGTWDGTFKPSWSDNPAWVFRDLALNDRYGLGNRITAAQLDKWALYKIARYCDEMVPDGKGGTEPRFTCNLYLQTRKQAYAVLQDIASIFRGISYWGAGTIMASADMPADPVYVYTAANVIGGKFTRTGTKKATRYTVALVTWNDPADGYKPKVEYVEDREGIARYGIQQTELTAFGCTSQGQAHRAGRWALATSRLETEGITFDVGMDGAIALPGQVVRIADPSRMGRRVGGRVRAVSGRTITLDKAPIVNVGDRLTVMMPAGASETRTVAAVSGDAVTVDSDWTTAPRAQAVWSVDSNELSAPLFRVLLVTEKDSITFTITAVQHEPGKYGFVENGTAITPRNQTALDVTRQAPPASVTLAGYTVSLADVQKLALQVSCAPVAGAVAYEGAYRRGNDNWIAIPRQPSPTMDVLDILPGAYMAKMAAVNSIGVTSVETQSVAVEIARDGASKNATIILQSDAQQFHIDENGQTDPLTITFSAILIALDGPVTWSCLGGTLTDTTATTAQLTFANASGPAAVVTAKVTAFGRTYTQSLTIRKVQDGAAGSDGLQTDVARLYQWAPTTPSKPGGTSTFSWAALTNGGYTGNDGWASPAPNNPGNPLWRLYVASVGVSAPIAATSSPVGYSNATIEAWSQNGANGSKGDTGASGVQSRPATVYRWDISIPDGPTGPATFKWSDGTYGAAPTNWTLTPGLAPSLGMTLFAATVQVTDSATAPTTAFNWQSAAVMAIGYVGTNGSKGDTGGKGAQGASYVTAYIASSAIAANGAPAPTTGRDSLPAANSSGLAGAWSATVPTLADSQRMYQSDGIFDPTTNTVTWSIPYWSSLKVATLSAITANLGAINGGSINLGNGTFTVDNAGNLVCYSIRIVDPNTGETVLQAGGKLNPKYAAAGTLNSDLVPSIQAAAATSTWNGTSGRPEDGAILNSAIQVGGRNLAEDSAFELRLRPWTSRSAAVAGVSIEGAPGSRNLVFDSNGGDAYVDGNGPWIPVVPGKQYMLSYEYATAAGGQITSSSSYIYYNNYNSGGIGGLELSPLNTGGGRVRHSIPWICPAGVTGISFRFGIVCNGYAWMRVYNFDVQEGNKAAPWSPAPEDLRAASDAAAQAAATAKAQADAAMGRVNNISNDGVLDRSEKGDAEIEFQRIYDEHAGIVAEANRLGVSYADWEARFYELWNYLGAIPGWGDHSSDSPIDRTTYNARFSNYYAARQALLNSLTAKNKALADAAALTAQYDKVTGRPTSYRVVAAGLNAQGMNSALGFYIENAISPTYGPGGMYTLVVIHRSERVVLFHGVYQTLGQPAQAQALANKLNSYGSNVIVVVYTYDEPQGNRMDGGLPAAMYRCGASRTVFGSPRFRYRSAYILVGIPGCGEGGGKEAYQGSVDDSVDAWCDIGLTIDALGNYQVSSDYTPSSLVDYGYIGDLDATRGAPAGTMVGNAEAQTVADWSYAGRLALNAIPNKLDAAASNILRAPIVITTGGGVVVGSLTYDATTGLRGGGSGVAITPYGIIAHNGSKYTFSLSGDSGNASFGGNLDAVTGTFGAVRIADGGTITSGAYTSFASPPAGGGTGWAITPQGITLGNYNDGRYVTLYTYGDIEAPGFQLVNKQLTLTNPVIITPKIQTTFSASIPIQAYRNVSGTSIVFDVPVTLSGGSGGPYRYSWTFNTSDGARFSMISNPSNSTLTLKASGSGWVYGYISVTVYDGAISASDSVEVSVQFGNAIEP